MQKAVRLQNKRVPNVGESRRDLPVERTGLKDLMSDEVNLIGRLAYEAYCKKTGGKSLATGDTLPEWIDLREPIRDAWGEAAIAVATEMKRRATDAFYGFALIW